MRMEIQNITYLKDVLLTSANETIPKRTRQGKKKWKADDILDMMESK